MTHELRIQRSARQDLHDIWSWHGQHDPLAADRAIHRLHDVFEMLADHPDVGHARPELWPDLRSFPVNGYIVFYRIAGARIVIDRVLHGARAYGPADFGKD